jgi:hypothetical protein
MSKFFTLLIFSLITVSMLHTQLEARRYQSRVYVDRDVGYSEPVYARRVHSGNCYGGCPRYTRGVPPVYAYPHNVYYGPPGIVYEEIYPYPPRCGRYY